MFCCTCLVKVEVAFPSHIRLRHIELYLRLHTFSEEMGVACRSHIILHYIVLYCIGFPSTRALVAPRTCLSKVIDIICKVFKTDLTDFRRASFPKFSKCSIAKLLRYPKIIFFENDSGVLLSCLESLWCLKSQI